MGCRHGSRGGGEERRAICVTREGEGRKLEEGRNSKENIAGSLSLSGGGEEGRKRGNVPLNDRSGVKKGAKRRGREGKILPCWGDPREVRDSVIKMVGERITLTERRPRRVTR